MTNRELIRTAEAKGIKVYAYALIAANGQRIRHATLVQFPDGRKVKFLDRIPKSTAIRQACEHRAWEL